MCMHAAGTVQLTGVKKLVFNKFNWILMLQLEAKLNNVRILLLLCFCKLKFDVVIADVLSFIILK
jgi:hypothetical protein